MIFVQPTLLIQIFDNFLSIY